MGLRKFIKKCVLTLGLFASMAYVGDSINFNDRFVYPITMYKRQVEGGFYEPLKIQRRIEINDNGNLETYIVNDGVDIPLLKGIQGPILEPDYERRNLTQDQLYAFVVQSWSTLNKEQRELIVSGENQQLLGERLKRLKDAIDEIFDYSKGGD